jgi:threonine dehydrogenase-like Zn-dependent dehydrogenase
VKQIVQPVSGGPVTLLDVPRPVPEPTEVLVRTLASVISPGTERAVTALAQSSLLAKARARPDLVRQAVGKARTEGIAVARQAVLGRLAQDVPLGYSAAGIVVEVGCAVTGVRPGQLVATGGAGKANHAEFQAVPGLLCAPVTGCVSVQDAAFTTIASIALHGLRIADVGPGAKVAVVGLGLIGQLVARLAMAAGCDVAGIDPAAYPRDIAARSGVLALDESGQETTERPQPP